LFTGIEIGRERQRGRQLILHAGLKVIQERVVFHPGVPRPDPAGAHLEVGAAPVGLGDEGDRTGVERLLGAALAAVEHRGAPARVAELQVEAGVERLIVLKTQALEIDRRADEVGVAVAEADVGLPEQTPPDGGGRRRDAGPGVLRVPGGGETEGRDRDQEGFHGNFLGHLVRRLRPRSTRGQVEYDCAGWESSVVRAGRRFF
jgi:hypothetical protein